MKTELIKIVSDNWGWSGLKPIRVIDINKFGNLILQHNDYSIWRIIPEELKCSKISNTLQEFEILKTKRDFQIDWEMRNLVELAETNLGDLEPVEIYCLMIPAVLGGKYDFDNMSKISLFEAIAFSGELSFKIKDLPDGTKLKLTFKK